MEREREEIEREKAYSRIVRRDLSITNRGPNKLIIVLPTFSFFIFVWVVCRGRKKRKGRYKYSLSYQ